MAASSAFLSDAPFIVAHRCGGADAPENTLYAALKALEAGARVLQVDCTFTKDKEIVVLHDEPKENNLRKLCGDDYEGVQASDVDWANFPKLLPRVPLNAMCDPGWMPTSASSFSTLRGFLSGLPPDALVLLELWSDDTSLVPAVISVVDSLDRARTTALGHPFNASISAAIDAANASRPSASLPPLSRIMNAGEILKANFTPRFIMAEPKSGVIYSVPVVTKRWGYLFSLLLKRARPPLWLRALLGMLGWAFWSPRTVAYMKARGVPTFGWILNDGEEREMARRLGVDGIMTDYVVEAVKELR
mmetsp:Transcript_603/g.1100  ORF Transcript_603/g.1100 Transcript_603/m.1100 type:complete len:304 (+) Transcript_603:160-1071(+)